MKRTSKVVSRYTGVRNRGINPQGFHVHGRSPLSSVARHRLAAWGGADTWPRTSPMVSLTSRREGAFGQQPVLNRSPPRLHGR